MKHSKRYTADAALRDPDAQYTPDEALAIIKQYKPGKFDETIEVSMRLGVDPRKADQMVRGTINLPNGTGKTARVLVFAQGAKADEAVAAGADEVGGDELIAKVNDGYLDFDSVVATPDLMGKVGRLGRVLGPRGLMPNPKLGTVTMDVAKMVGELKAGRVEYRADRYGICHVPLGKASFELADLVDNYQTLIAEILRVKPATAKGRYIKSIAFSSTMGPGVKVDTTKVRALMED